jgi:hypothetical protein
MRRILFLSLVLAACSRSPSEPAGTTQPSANTTPTAAHSVSPEALQAQAHGAHPPVPHGPQHLALAWDDPVRWQKRVPSTPMRAAEYRVPRAASDSEDGECSVITFGPGQGGSVDDNISRWVKQLEPTAGAVDRATRTVNGMTVTRVEVAGTYTPMAMPAIPTSPARQGYRLVGEIVEAPSGAWFFKMTGPDATVKAAGKELDKLVESIRPNDAAGGPSAEPSQQR